MYFSAKYYVRTKLRQLISVVLLLMACTLSEAQEIGFEGVSIIIDNSNIRLYNQSHALLIGVSKYQDSWPDLPGVKQDIYAVQTTLEQHNFNVVVLEDPKKQELDNAIGDFIAKYGQGAENRLLFYFAGHGHTINTSYGGKLGYIVPADAPNPHNNEANFQNRAIEMAQIEIYAKRIQSKHVIFIFDACFSGSLFATTRAIPEIISYKTTEPIRQFITSGTENETVPDKSIFREQFVNALTTDIADGNRDGFLTGTELGEFLQSTVTNYSYNSQHPQYGKIRNPMLDKGDFVFLVGGSSPVEKVVREEMSGEAGDPVLGDAVHVQAMGRIELDSEVEGILFLDGKELGEIRANTKIPINRVPTGEHLIEVKGRESWSRSVTIFKDQSTRLTISSTGKSASYGVARSGDFTDTRYNEEYKWVKIGSQIWMSENLSYQTTYGSWCLNDDESNCDKYGRLYSWEAAKIACPQGWHLPTDEEWKELEAALGMSPKQIDKTSYRGNGGEGGKLKEIGLEHWLAPNKGSTNTSGFSALPGGYRIDDGDFQSMGKCAIFWTATPHTKGFARNRELYHSRIDIFRDISNKTYGFSVRCVRD